MRIRNLLAPLLLASTSLACEGSNDPTVATPGPVESPATSDPAPSASIQAPGTIEAPTGKPITLDGRAPAGRTVVVVDASGVRREAVVDDKGSFRIPQVLAPYDIGIVFEDAKQQAWLGATRSDPTLAEPMPAESVSSTIPLDIAATVPGCGTCTLTIATSSLHGTGNSTIEFGGPTRSFHLQVTHQLVAFTGSEGVDAHVLVDGHDGVKYWYGHLYIPATDLGAPATVAIAPIGVIGNSAAVLHDTGVPATWSRTTSLSLTIGRRASFPLVAGQAVSVVAHVPNVPGAELQAEGQAFGIAPSDKWTTGAKSGFFPLSTTQIDVDGALDFQPEVPTAGTSISMTAPKISWKRPPGAVTRFAIGPTSGPQTTHIVTPAPLLDRARLASLGIATLAVGPENIVLRDEAAKTTDDTLAADYASPSPIAFHNYAFTVTE